VRKKEEGWKEKREEREREREREREDGENCERRTAS